MKPEQFIREQGFDKAREVVEVAPEGADFAIDQTFSGKFMYLKNINGDEYDEFTNGKWVHINHFSFNSGCGFGVVCIDLRILKRLVESVDLVNRIMRAERCDFLSGLKASIKGPCGARFPKKLKQAIADYESIYGEGNE